jgi:hypothetical protein
VSKLFNIEADLKRILIVAKSESARNIYKCILQYSILVGNARPTNNVWDPTQLVSADLADVKMAIY